MIETDITVFYYYIKSFNRVGWNGMQCEEVDYQLNQILTHCWRREGLNMTCYINYTYPSTTATRPRAAMGPPQDTMEGKDLGDRCPFWQEVWSWTWLGQEGRALARGVTWSRDGSRDDVLAGAWGRGAGGSVAGRRSLYDHPWVPSVDFLSLARQVSFVFC